MVCEDNVEHHKPLSRSPTEHEKYYNVIQWSSLEAMEECMGILERAIALTADNDLSIIIDTRWRTSPPVDPDKGYVQ